MTYDQGALQVDNFLAVTLGIIVLFLGKRLTATVPFLRKYSIPEPVSGGILVSLVITLFYYTTGIEVNFTLNARDILLVYFFTTIGINASFKDLISGGKPLLMLLVITVVYMFLQNLTGLGVASLLGQDAGVGLLGGTVSLIGGHGTAIAWAPKFAGEHGISNAMEMRIASATCGLSIASSLGSPISRFLIRRYDLHPAQDRPLDVGVTHASDKQGVDSMDLLDAVLAIHICIIIGLLSNEALVHFGLKLPVFVSCLFAGILITNLKPNNFPSITGTQWPSRTPAMALIADVSLGTFLAMSLMSLQLWDLVALAGPILAVMTAQMLVVTLVILLLVFPAMGKNYDAAVISAGFAGFSMGATPTAMANMSAVTKRYGASHVAFIIVPLMGAFFIDLVNAFIIQFFIDVF